MQLTICLLICSCTNSEHPEKESIYFKAYYTDENLKEIRYLDQDSIQHVRNYHVNGKLGSEGVLVDDQRHGKHNFYYESGELEQTVHFKNGIRHGISEGYHQNQTLWLRYNYKEGFRTGEGFEYDENGHLSAYLYYNDYNVQKEALLFRCDYDTNGSIIKEIGSVILRRIINKQTLNRGDTLNLKIDLASPPAISRYLRIDWKYPGEMRQHVGVQIVENCDSSDQMFDFELNEVGIHDVRINVFTILSGDTISKYTGEMQITVL